MTLGVYLLGALDPVERSAFESHLSYCEICRGELVRLAPLPGLLNQITQEDFADDLPPIGAEGVGTAGAVATIQPITEPVPLQVPAPEPLSPVRETAVGNGTQVRKRYWRVASAAAAVVVLAVGAIFGWQAIRHDPITPAQGVVWTATSQDGTVHAEVRLIDHDWGTEILTKIDGLPPERDCFLQVWDHYGNRQIAGWWDTDHDPEEAIPGSVSIRRGKIDRMEFMLHAEYGDGDDPVVLTMEPAG